MLSRIGRFIKAKWFSLIYVFIFVPIWFGGLIYWDHFGIVAMGVVVISFMKVTIQNRFSNDRLGLRLDKKPDYLEEKLVTDIVHHYNNKDDLVA